ncbi:MAG: hypothetical protein ACI9FU_001860 [Granulosicoccus sp.]|jgi:hypothetical protein
MFYRFTSIVILSFICAGQVFSQNTVCFDIEPNPLSGDAALGGFTKYVNVHGFEIFGENNVSDAQVLHAAAVAAELLDNDEDGVVDDQLLLTQLIGSGALMPMFNNEGSPMENTFFSNYTGNGVSAVLYATEVDPTQPGHWGNDATVEEILHTINHIGHSALHPTIFGFDANSSLMSAAMDSARGGQWLTIPNPYPSNAWYHYDDQTCDYGCMAIEYIYWSIVSNMGILDDPQTCSGIANEWEPCSPALFQSTDVAMHALISDPQYKIPQNAPDGNYCPAGISIDEVGKIPLKTYPNPTFNAVAVELEEAELIQVLSSNGQVVLAFQGNKGLNELNLSQLPKGTYSISTSHRQATVVLQ